MDEMKARGDRRHKNDRPVGNWVPTLRRRWHGDSSALGFSLVLWLCLLVVLVVILRLWLGLGLAVTATVAALALLAILLLRFALHASWFRVR